MSPKEKSKIEKEPEKSQEAPKEDLNTLIEKDKNERLQNFGNECDVLCKKYNISLIPKITLIGKEVIAEIAVIAN